MPCRHLLAALFMSLAVPFAQAADSFDYQLRDLDDRLYRALDCRGKWLVINFWATWCAPCIHEMPELERFYQQHKATAMVWDVTFEDGARERVREFADRLGVSYPILGHGQDPLTGYGKVRVLPTTFLIDPQGLFQHRFEGPVSARDLVDEIGRRR